MNLECHGFGEAKHQLATVAAGSTAIIWDLRITGDYVAFIDQLIAVRGDNQLGANGTYLDWFIDGAREDRINREIPLNNPKEFHPPLVAKKRIYFNAVNPDVLSHVFEVVCDGQLCRRLESPLKLEPLV